MRATLPAGVLPRLLAGLDPSGQPAWHAQHEQVYGPLPTRTPERLIEEVRRSGLHGRGGADFPVARKLAAVAEASSVSAVIVNGSETEPASGKDRTLLSGLPHLVLDGAVTAAQTVGAREVIVMLGAIDLASHQALEVACAERQDPVPVSIVTGEGGYVSGEETAVIQGLNRGTAVPTFTPPRPFERGYRNRPTLVQNAETLAHLALITRYGARWYRALGTNADPGTALTTLTGAVRHPGVYEVAFGTPLTDLIAAAGGTTEPLQAVLVGGYFGTWAGAAAAHRMVLAREPLRAEGHALGAGVMIVLGRSECGLHASAALAGYLADQSAGQCGPCVHGLRTLADDFAALLAHGDSRGAARIERVARMVDGRGACAHPNGAVRLIRSALQVFGHDLAEHRHRCRASAPTLPGLARAGR